MRLSAKSLFIAILIAGCSGWNSELQTKTFDDPNISEKPRCQFKVKNNCWQRSMALLQDCFISSGVEPLFSDSEVCGDEQNQLVVFSKPLKGYQDLAQDPIEFKLYKNKVKCLRFSGTQDNFIIDNTAYGSLQVATLANGDRLVSCFSDESFVIPAEAQASGCQGEKISVSQFTPQALLSVAESERPQFTLTLSGLVESQPVFQCQ